MPPPTADLLDRFRHVAGEGGWSDEPERMAPRLTDWRGRVTGASALMLMPSDTATLGRLVALAAETATPLVPQGGNTGLVGGATPSADGASLLVSMERMNRIRGLDAEDFSAVAEAGVILETLQQAAKAADRMFPLSLGAKGSATVGGLVSTNAGGTQVLRYGPMRALVLGLEAVLPDGRVLDQLRPLRKDNSGYDIKQLLIGAEGTLGFVTAAALKLVPAPREVVTAMVGLAAPEAALDLLGALRAATGDTVDSFELLPRDALALVLAHVPGTRDPFAGAQPWYVLVEATSPAPGNVLRQALEGALSGALEAGRIADAVIAATEAQAAALWRLRESIAEAERVDGPSIKHDVSVPVSAMPRFMAEAGGIVEAEWPGAKIFAFGHLGDGNVHFNVRTAAPSAREALIARQAEVSARVYDIVAGYGGSISAEHGIGTSKAATLARLGDPAKLAAMRAVKRALDPANIMNPGKIFGAAL